MAYTQRDGQCRRANAASKLHVASAGMVRAKLHESFVAAIVCVAGGVPVPRSVKDVCAGVRHVWAWDNGTVWVEALLAPRAEETDGIQKLVAFVLDGMAAEHARREHDGSILGCCGELHMVA